MSISFHPSCLWVLIMADQELRQLREEISHLPLENSIVKQQMFMARLALGVQAQRVLSVHYASLPFTHDAIDILMSKIPS
jgi:hypothetical protein